MKTSRTTHVYMLVGDGWVYPGRHVEPSKRIVEHLAGKCKTTAPRIRADGVAPIMVPMEDYDFDLRDAPEPNGEAQLWLDLRDGRHVPPGYDILANWPFSCEAMAQGIKTQHVEKDREGRSIHAVRMGRVGNRVRHAPENRDDAYYAHQRKAASAGGRAGNNMGAAKIANHNRYHIKRGQFNRACMHCILDAAFMNLIKEEADG